MLEALLLNSLAIWFAFYVVNHADITSKIRVGLYPALPGWLVSLVACPLCATFWTMAAYSLLIGYTPFLLWCPPTVLFIDLIYRRLKPADMAPPLQP